MSAVEETAVQPVNLPKKSPGERFPIEKRFKKGVSGNPAGRKPGTGLYDLLLVKLGKVEDTKGVKGRKALNELGETWRERLVRSLLLHAEAGHPVAMKEVWERVEGKVKQDLNITSEQDLWSKLSAGRLRIAIVADPAPGQLIDVTPTFDAPADTPTSSGDLESVTCESAEPVKCTTISADPEPTEVVDHNP